MNLIGLAQEVEERLATVDKPVKVAVMGCVVNGPGEAADENRLQSLVRNLRRKTEFACSRIGRITSVYGLGYRLDTMEGGGG